METGEITKLLNTYHTHPSVMDNSSLLGQHDGLHKQVTSFERLLQHAMSKFSRDKLYNMLRVATKVAGSISNNGRSSPRLNSFGAPKELLSNAEFQQQHESMYKYFQIFLEDVEYLNDLKRHFDEKIYKCLYEYFYDPEADLDENDLRSPEPVRIYSGDSKRRNRSRNNSFNDSDDDGDESEDMDNINSKYDKSKLSKPKYDKTTHPEEDQQVNFELFNDQQKMSHAVKQLFIVNEKWDLLFEDEEVDNNIYDPDSYHELLQYRDFSTFEKLLRVVPDIFCKAYKSVEMAKLWWTQYNKIFPAPTAKKRTSRDIDKTKEKLKAEIYRLDDELRHQENEILRFQEDWELLKARESHYQSLAALCEQLEEKKSHLAQKYNECCLEQELLKTELESHRRGSRKYKESESRLKESYKRLMSLKGDLNLVTYEFDLNQDDFCVSSEMRPDFIRYSATAEIRVKELEEEIITLRVKKRDKEKRLVLILTNCERMRKIMEKILNNPSSQTQQEINGQNVNGDSSLVNGKSDEEDDENGSDYAGTDKESQFSEDEKREESENETFSTTNKDFRQTNGKPSKTNVKQSTANKKSPLRNEKRRSPEHQKTSKSYTPNNKVSDSNTRLPKDQHSNRPSKDRNGHKDADIERQTKVKNRQSKLPHMQHHFKSNKAKEAPKYKRTKSPEY